MIETESSSVSFANLPSVTESAWEKLGEIKEVYWSGSSRFLIERQKNSDIPKELARIDALTEQGISADERDSQRFAESLYAAIEDQLSIRDLENLVKVFESKLRESEAERQAAMRKMTLFA
ncbi:hypothetical protein LC612_36285 [Nostoc sp. CHAB 5834]|nr:hypothetical protein [Nostoc sp. CHAB 5834]